MKSLRSPRALRSNILAAPRSVSAGLTLALWALGCGSGPRARGPAAPWPFEDARAGVSLTAPAAPFERAPSSSPRSVVHFAERRTRAGLHILWFPSDGPIHGEPALVTRAAAYQRG